MTKGLQHLGRDFPCASDPEPVAFPGLITVVPTNNDLPREVLEVVRALAIWGVLYRMLCSEFLEPKVGETVDMIEDPQHRQGLHCIQVKLREADVQVQQGLPEERGKRQPEPLEEVVLVHDDVIGGGRVG